MGGKRIPELAQAGRAVIITVVVTVPLLAISLVAVITVTIFCKRKRTGRKTICRKTSHTTAE